MQRRKERVTRELSAAAVIIKVRLVSESRKILSEKVYSVPIPLRPRNVAGLTRSQLKKLYHADGSRTSTQRVGGKNVTKWKRSGQLLARESGRTEGPVVYLFNPMAYAVARYILGTAEGGRIVTSGVQSVQWEAEAVQRNRSFILEERRKGVRRALQS